MPRHKGNRYQLHVLLTHEDYENLMLYAKSTNQTMSDVARTFISQGLTGNLTEKNIDFLTPIIREQLKSILDAKFERMAALTAKTCIQAGTAAYLSAEALNSFVPPQHQRSFVEAYEVARKKSVQYMRNASGIAMPEEEENKN